MEDYLCYNPEIDSVEFLIEGMEEIPEYQAKNAIDETYIDEMVNERVKKYIEDNLSISI